MTQEELNEIAGYCRLAFGHQAGAYNDGVDAMLHAVSIAQSQAAVEPEIAMIDAAMVEMKNITPPLRRSECQRLIRAALSAQPAATDTQAALLVAREALRKSANYMKCTEAVFSRGLMYLDMTLMPSLYSDAEAAIAGIDRALGRAG